MPKKLILPATISLALNQDSLSTQKPSFMKRNKVLFPSFSSYTHMFYLAIQQKRCRHGAGRRQMKAPPVANDAMSPIYR